MRLVSAGFSHVGRRNNNEDAFCAEPTLGLFAVADGMGGYEGGEVASRTAIETVRRFVRENASDDDVTWPFKLDPNLRLDENMASTAVRLAHHDVRTRKQGVLGQMGSTIVTLLFTAEHAILAHLGDSRIYRLRAGVLEQLTSDHSVYEEMRKANGGQMPPKDQCSFGHMITRALGMEPEPQVELRREAVHVGDTFLLCSDGVTEVLSDDALAVALGDDDVNALCRALVQAAYDAGGRDNITAVVVRAELG